MRQIQKIQKPTNKWIVDGRAASNERAVRKKEACCDTA